MLITIRIEGDVVEAVKMGMEADELLPFEIEGEKEG